MKIATFNIRYDEVNDGCNSWKHRKDKICQMINFHEWSIFGLQEALKHQLDYISNNLPDYNYIGVGREDGKEAGEFVPIFYKKDTFYLEESKTFWLSETPQLPSKSWNSACTRICTVAKLVHKKTQNKITVMNTHFDHESEEARFESAKLIIKMAKEIGNEEKIIILGDFNSIPTERCYKELSKVFSDVSIICKKTYYGPKGTFNNFEFNKSWNDIDEIDHIFINEKIIVEKAATLTDNIDRKYLSDHFPIVAKIKI